MASATTKSTLQKNCFANTNGGKKTVLNAGDSHSVSVCCQGRDKMLLGTPTASLWPSPQPRKHPSSSRPAPQFFATFSLTNDTHSKSAILLQWHHSRYNRSRIWLGSVEVGMIYWLCTSMMYVIDKTMARSSKEHSAQSCLKIWPTQSCPGVKSWVCQNFSRILTSRETTRPAGLPSPGEVHSGPNFNGKIWRRTRLL